MNLQAGWARARSTVRGVAPLAYPLVDELAARTTPSRRRVRWSKTWNDDLEAALEELPSLDYCTREHFRLLADGTDIPKRHALVTDAGSPVAVVSVRRRPRFWEPVTDLCVPHVTVPSIGDQFADVLAEVGRDVRLGAYPTDPAGLPATWYMGYDVYQADLTDDFEKYWKSRGRRKSINYARNQCEHMEFRLDDRDDLDWIVDTWSGMWDDSQSQVIASAPDMRRAWPTMMRDGLIRTFMLLENGEPMTGTVLYCRDGVAVGRITARRMEREHRSAGTRLLDLTFHTLADEGYRLFDLGGGFDYKRWWAPPVAQRYNVAFVPKLLQRAQQAIERSRALSERLRRPTESEAPPSAPAMP